MQVQGKKIAFISARSGFVENNKSFRLDFANGRLIQELNYTFPERLSVALFSDPFEKKSYSCQIKVSKVYSLPFPFSHPGGIKNIVKIYRVLKRIESENDLLIIQLPIVGFLAFLFIRKPTIYHVCANVLSAADNSFKYKGLNRILALLFAKLLHTTNKILFNRRESKLIVNGEELGKIYNKYKPKVVVSTSVYDEEIIPEGQISPRDGRNFKILFVGRPSKEKGVHLLLMAFEKLVNHGYSVTLEMIGMSKDELIRSFSLTPIAESVLARITCYGFLLWGEEFKTIVRNCHGLVMCSTSEGTPRVLIEARALGCAVIATDVGGVKSSIKNGYDGLLIKPFDDDSIYESIKELVTKEDLRMRLIKNGLSSVRSFTIESFAKNFEEVILQYK